MYRIANTRQNTWRTCAFKGSEWTAILNIDVWNLIQITTMPALHLSYQYLPSRLKRCFSYCSIFRKDCLLDMKKLVWIWTADGFLDYSQSEKEAEDVDDDYFAEFLSRSLIRQSYDDTHGEKFVMQERPELHAKSYIILK